LQAGLSAYEKSKRIVPVSLWDRNRSFSRWCRQAKKLPFVDVPDPPDFAIKIIATILLTNLSGYGFYRVRGLSAAGAG
jgi:hypothetical protein